MFDCLLTPFIPHLCEINKAAIKGLQWQTTFNSCCWKAKM